MRTSALMMRSVLLRLPIITLPSVSWWYNWGIRTVLSAYNLCCGLSGAFVILFSFICTSSCGLYLHLPSGVKLIPRYLHVSVLLRNWILRFDTLKFLCSITVCLSLPWPLMFSEMHLELFRDSPQELRKFSVWSIRFWRPCGVEPY